MGELTRILQHVHLPCWIIDDDGIFVWVNGAFVETFGDQTGEHYSTVIAPESLDDAAKHIGLTNESSVGEYEAEMMLPDGSRVDTEVSSVRLEGIGLCCGAFGLAGTPAQPRPAERPDLTPRQLEILALLSHGASTEQIAKELFISKTTVRNHVANLLGALGVHSRIEAVAKARRERIVED